VWKKDDMRAAEYLKQPYGRLVTPESDGTFVAEIFEFPGCYAVGATALEAMENLEGVAIDWISAALEQGQSIPEPMDHIEYSGKTVLRMAKGLHKRAAQCAEREGVSLNTFIVTCVAEQVGMRAKAVSQFEK
jgi:predicted RNase H-like HicB family nuclease